jgi:hypothetical protein
MPKAVQLVHGTPRLAASHRTCGRGGEFLRGSVDGGTARWILSYLSCMAGLLERSTNVHKTSVPRRNQTEFGVFLTTYLASS